MTKVRESANPKLSVIVPVHNSTDQLRHCLAALARSDLPGSEVIVVDDGSSEPVAPLVSEHGFRYLRIEGPRGPAFARNRGVAAAANDLVVFIDSDVCVHTDTLARIATAFVNEPDIAAVVGCYDESPAAPNFVSQYKNLFHHFVHSRNSGNLGTFWSGCGAMRKEVFMRFGGFDEQLYRRPSIEDIELGTWVAAAGNRILLDTRIRARHLKRWTLSTLIKTDVFDRGVPWMRLMLRSRCVPNTLNLKAAQRLSVGLVYVALLAAIIALWHPLSFVVSIALALTVAALNLDFYRYFIGHRGVWFTLRALPLHWLYFAYCGFSAAWGVAAHYLSELRTSPTTRR